MSQGCMNSNQIYIHTLMIFWGDEKGGVCEGGWMVVVGVGCRVFSTPGCSWLSEWVGGGSGLGRRGL